MSREIQPCEHIHCAAPATHHVAWIGRVVGGHHQRWQCATHLPFAEAVAADLGITLTVTPIEVRHAA